MDEGSGSRKQQFYYSAVFIQSGCQLMGCHCRHMTFTKWQELMTTDVDDGSVLYKRVKVCIVKKSDWKPKIKPAELRNRVRRDELDNLPRGRSFLTENFLSESKALISWQGIYGGASELPDGLQEGTKDACQPWPGIGRKRGTQQPHTKGGWRAIPHALSRHSMGEGVEKGAG